MKLVKYDNLQDNKQTIKQMVEKIVSLIESMEDWGIHKLTQILTHIEKSGELKKYEAIFKAALTKNPNNEQIQTDLGWITKRKQSCERLEARGW